MASNWYSELDRTEKRTFWACFGGYTLDSLDSTMYALVAPVFITIVGFSKPEIGALTTTGLVGNAIGGWVAGALADRFGRMKLLNLTILWVAVFSGATALLTDHRLFFVVRFLQGLGFGGEAAVAGVLISEAMRPHLRGRVASAVQSGYGFGYALSTGLMSLVFALVSTGIGWRLMFAAGVVPALLVLYIRRFVPESHAYEASAAAQRAGAAPDRPPFWAIFQSGIRRDTLLGLLLAAGILGGGFGIHAWLPTYLRLSLHLRVTSATGYLALSVAGLLIGPILGGILSDRITRRATFILLLLCEALVLVLLLFVRINLQEALGLIFVQATLQGGAAACMLPTFAELFPTAIRASGTGFCITGGRGVGSICTSVVGLLATIMPLGHAMGASSLVAFSLAVVAAIFLPDRSRLSLEPVAAVPVDEIITRRPVVAAQPPAVAR